MGRRTRGQREDRACPVHAFDSRGRDFLELKGRPLTALEREHVRAATRSPAEGLRRVAELALDGTVTHAHRVWAARVLVSRLELLSLDGADA